jgi:hypothetical protein
MNMKQESLLYVKQRPIIVFLIAALLITIISLACRMPVSEVINETQVAINAQSTQLAQRETEIVLTEIASTSLLTESEDSNEPNLQATLAAQQATHTALQAEATLNAQIQIELAQEKQEQTNQETEAILQPAVEEPAQNIPDFETWMQSSASILLYEDMSGDFSVYRFIKSALDAMGLGYVDVKDALGNYKEQLLSGGPGGKGWDLIISGKELRTSVQGEFYVYINDALNQGSSVIIEEWDSDGIGAGKLSTILSRCGVEFQRDWLNIPMAEQLLYPINGTHPIHHLPNEGISLTNPSGYWNWTDLGDLLRLTPGSSAKLLWGARTNINDSYGTAATCFDGQLIIQTYSSHSYGQDRIERMWQNYVYNALKSRYKYLYNQ